MTMRKIFEKHSLRTGLICLFILSFIVLQRMMVKRIDPEGSMMRLFDSVKDAVFEWGLLVKADFSLLTLGPTIKRDLFSLIS